MRSGVPEETVLPIAPNTDREDFTTRTLLAIANDIAILEETTDRVVTMFRALAFEYDVT